MKYLKYYLIIGLAFSLINPVHAIDSTAGTAGMQFLKIGVGARQIAMGEASCAAGLDANTIYQNPAGLTSAGSQVILSQNQSFANIQEQTIAGSFQTKAGSFGASIQYLHMDSMTGYDVDAQGNPVKASDFTSYDMAVTLSYARVFGGIPIGINLKVLQEKLASYQANGAALDIGMTDKLMENLNFGFAVQNIGPAVTFISDTTPLPLNVKMGLAYNGLGNNLTVTADANKPIDDSLKACFGAEYRLNEVLSLRAGFNQKDGVDSWITAGIGMDISGWTLDYAYVPYGTLGDTHRLSIGTRFGK